LDNGCRRALVGTRNPTHAKPARRSGDSVPRRHPFAATDAPFQLQYDSEESRRGSFDANVVIKEQMLALRLMGLSKREYTFKRPNLDRD
jgi:hypothetical protein